MIWPKPRHAEIGQNLVIYSEDLKKILLSTGAARFRSLMMDEIPSGRRAMRAVSELQMVCARLSDITADSRRLISACRVKGSWARVFLDSGPDSFEFRARRLESVLQKVRDSHAISLFEAVQVLELSQELVVDIYGKQYFDEDRTALLDGKLLSFISGFEVGFERNFDMVLNHSKRRLRDFFHGIAREKGVEVFDRLPRIETSLNTNGSSISDIWVLHRRSILRHVLEIAYSTSGMVAVLSKNI